jgi:antitoxin (DNA-binding transcriptional repressor) of toxin-antitoxin stability system
MACSSNLLRRAATHKVYSALHLRWRLYKNRLTEYLRRTKKGEEIIVTERGKPIAVIQQKTQELRAEGRRNQSEYLEPCQNS